MSGIVPLVRITDPAADWMYMRVLEAGAKGVIIPRVREAADVRRALQQIKYPPLGTHGLCPWGRRFRYGADTEGQNYGYLDSANEDVLVSVIIETREGFDNLDEILSVDGIDFAIWGPLDMLAAMGFKGREVVPRGPENHGRHAGDHEGRLPEARRAFRRALR